jgi:carboxypeptidase T
MSKRTPARRPARPTRLLNTLAAAALASTLAPAALAHGTHGAHTTDGQAARAAERQRTQVYKAWFPDLATARRAAISLHGALLETEYERGWQVFELDGAQIALLQRFGYRLEPATDFLRRRDAFLAAIDQANTQRRALNPAAAEVGVQAIPGYSCYETVEETFSAAQALIAAKPGLATWVDVGDSWQKTQGIGGYDMGVLKISNSAITPATGAKPKLFITSAIHAREYVTAPLALAFARWLVNGYGTDPEATWLVDHHEVHLMLHTNPDGRKKAETGLSWRKNTNTAYCASRPNNVGADLNRNFTFSWNTTNGQGSSGNQCDLTYRGPSAASEPETRAVEAYIRSLWADNRGPNVGDAAPDTTSGIHIDLHSYSQLVLWPWGDTAAVAPNGAALQTLGRRFAWFNGYTPQQSVGLYPTDGTSDSPSYGELGVAAYTFELGTSFFQDCASYENTIKPKNLQALVYAAKVSRAPYLLPGGPDVSGITLAPPAGQTTVVAGVPVTLTASATDTRFNQSNGTEATQNVVAAQAYIGVPPWAPGASPRALTAADGGFNSTTEALVGTLDTSGLATGKHLVWVTATDASGRTGPATAAYLEVGGTPPPPPAITLSLTSSRIRVNSWQVNLAWANAQGVNVDVYRNGTRVVTTANDGAYSETRSRGTWAYKVCAAGTTTCSAEQTVRF